MSLIFIFNTTLLCYIQSTFPSLPYLSENVQHELLRLMCKNNVATLHRTGSHRMYGFKSNQQHGAVCEIATFRFSFQMKDNEDNVVKITRLLSH